MASIEELRLMREARAGQKAAQVALGKRYLNGEGTCSVNHMTAFYWLDKAALQNEQEAWLLIGEHVTLDIVLRTPDPARALRWYEMAFDANVWNAGYVFARLILDKHVLTGSDTLRRKAWYALEMAARADIPEAQLWMAQHLEAGTVLSEEPTGTADIGTPVRHLEWLTRAAKNGQVTAQGLLANMAWAHEDYPEYLKWALPMARALAIGYKSRKRAAQPYLNEQLQLLARCGYAMSVLNWEDVQETDRFLEISANHGDVDSQLLLGLRCARMNAEAQRDKSIATVANYKAAMQWLSKAAAQGSADAWYAMSKVSLKNEFAGLGRRDTQRFLEQAGEAGHVKAQLELGKKAWQARDDHPGNDVQASYWLQKAAALGNEEAKTLLDKIITYADPAKWAEQALHRFGPNVDPFLKARIELAYVFGLSQTEALLLDIHTVDQRHCFLVDIKAERVRAKRKLIAIRTRDQREVLNRATRLFENVDCGPSGPEGNFRQRQYRLNAALARRNQNPLDAGGQSADGSAQRAG
jgi:TPR repeat protein